MCPPLVHLVLLALAAPPVLVRHLSTLCPPSVVGFGPLVRQVSPRCPPCVCLVSALCSWLLPALCPPCVLVFGRSSSPCRPLVRQVFAYNVRLYSVWILFTVGPSCVRHHVLSARLCPLLTCCGAEPWHHQVKFFLTIAQPTAFILHARWSIFLAFILVPQIRPLQAHPVLQKLFGVYAGIIFHFATLY